jgi:hypothetical protein
MILVATEKNPLKPRERHLLPNDLRTWATRYIEQDVDGLYASASLVEQEANCVGGAHFHAADQFQVVVAGSGLYGKTPVARYSVHYAAAFSPYGPIRTADEDLKWYTLRNGRDPGGIKWMPASRDALRAGERKPRVVLGEPEIELQHDGLGAWRHVLAPGEELAGVAPASGSGQYWVVLNGSGSVAGHVLEQQDLLFASPAEPAVTVRAGQAGLEILALQFPRTA